MTIDRLIQELVASDREPVASELEVLQSIYGSESIRTWRPDDKSNKAPHDPTLRYEVTLSFPSQHDEISVKVLVSLPPSYPSTSAPQLQLLSRYIGPYGADSALFGSVLKTFISVNGVEWSPDLVCVFDGLQSVLDHSVAWYENHLNADKLGNLVREDDKEIGQAPVPEILEPQDVPGETMSQREISLPPGIQIYEAEAITDRKSAFVGRACEIRDPKQVPLVLSHLLANKRISRAAHPIINAWRCQVGSIIHQDNDDDGETAAGGRLAHLLQILEVNNVLVIVTRYFGGIHLGPDRFKHINQAARNALEIGGFLDSTDSSKKTRSRKH